MLISRTGFVFGLGGEVEMQDGRIGYVKECSIASQGGGYTATLELYIPPCIDPVASIKRILIQPEAQKEIAQKIRDIRFTD